MTTAYQVGVAPVRFNSLIDYNVIWKAIKAGPDYRLAFGNIGSPAMHAGPWDLFGWGDWRKFLVTLNGANIGVGAIAIDKPNRVCNLELALLPAFRGYKYGGIAGRILIRKCFEDYDARLVEGSALSTNSRSINMRDWMQLEATLKARWLIDGQEVDELVYTITKTDWLAIQQRIRNRGEI